MVDLDEIDRIFQEYFTWGESYSIRDDGTVDVVGTCTTKKHLSGSDAEGFPVKFGTIQGTFVADRTGLGSLYNSPREVYGDFMVQDNPLFTLKYAPDYISGDFYAHRCGLTKLECPDTQVSNSLELADNYFSSLEGLPKVGMYLNLKSNDILRSLEGWNTGCYSILLEWKPNMPLLKCLQARQGVGFTSNYKVDTFKQREVSDILNDERWLGKGKTGAIPCAAALIKAGYAGNAKW
jgi:hypothetical protein